MQYFICDKCDARVDEDHVIDEAYPDLYMNPLRDVCLQLDAEKGVKPPPSKRYHRVHSYHRFGGTRGFDLCGPLHPESEQEYFLHWVNGEPKERNEPR